MSISVDSLSSYVNNISSAADSSSSIESNLENTDFSNASAEELMDVCKQFEAYFLEQVFKEMEKTIPEEDSSDSGMSTMKSYYKEQMIQEYAAEAADGEGVGLAKTLYEQMKRNYNISDAES
jgi:flagellar protein FlgJ